MISLFIMIIFAVLCGLLAANKGRNIVGWVLCGFFFPLIALIVILCVSNLKEERQYRELVAMKNRRLSEQLRQEQLKSEALRRHVVARLDAHDNVLGVDTRQTTALPPPDSPVDELTGALSPLPADTDEAAASLSRMAEGTISQQAAGNATRIESPDLVSRPQAQWFYATNGQSCGPIGAIEILAMLRTGALKSDTMLWSQMLTEWTPAVLIPEFAKACHA